MNDLWSRVIELERRKRKAASQLDLMGQQLAELQSRRNQQALGPYYPGTGSPEIVLEYVKRIEVRLKIGIINQYQYSEPSSGQWLYLYDNPSGRQAFWPQIVNLSAQQVMFDWQYVNTFSQQSQLYKQYQREFITHYSNNWGTYRFFINLEMFYNLTTKKTRILSKNSIKSLFGGDWYLTNGFDGILIYAFEFETTNHPIINTTGEIDIPVKVRALGAGTVSTLYDALVSIRWGSLGTIPDTGGTPAGTGDKLLIQSSGDWGSLGTGELTDGGTF